MPRLLTFSILGLFLFAPCARAWEIENFDAELSVQPDGGLIVREKINADFQGEERHGIYRDIPTLTQTRAGIRQSIHLKFLSAVDEEGRSWHAQVTRHGAYQRIRLGSPDVTYSGQKNFSITYRVDRALQSYPDHDELYWNVTGNGWTVPVLRSTATLRLPKSPPAGELKTAAYTGSYGSRSSDVQMEFPSDDTVSFRSIHALAAFEGLTIVAGWPAGLTSMPTTFQKIGWFLEDNWFFGIPILVFFIMWGLWWTFGRDPKKGTITVQYDPPEGLTPGEVGTFIDDKADLRDVTATIVDLARRGYLHIEQISKSDYMLTRTHPQGSAWKSGLKDHEILVLEALFGKASEVHLSDLENRFYEDLPGIQSALYKSLDDLGYWHKRPDEVLGFWWMAAGVFFVGGWFACALVNASLPMVLSMCMSAGIIAVFAPFMPQKTPQGMKVLEKTLGFEEFLRRTDEDRLRREPEPAALFERMLPYAMALGVASQWAKAFEEIYQVQPRWYSSYSGGLFTPYDFTHRMQLMSGQMGNVLASTPRVSGGSGFGGGFSGGGGGGGGGGAW